MTDRMQQLIQELERVDGQPPGSGLAKHSKMAASPFLFLRGSAQLFYADLANSTLALPDALYELPLTYIIGDCHMSNFGFLTEEGSHGDRVIFAPNDFDDACFGHAVWDLARFGVSLLLSAEHCREGEQADKPAVTERQAVSALKAFLKSYTETCKRHHIQGCQGHVLDDFGKNHILGKKFRIAKKRAFGGPAFMTKSSLARSVDLRSRPMGFRNRPERFRRLSSEAYSDVESTLAPYADDRILDIVERLGAGTGSSNLRRYYLLVGPNAIVDEGDLSLCHIVEVKQQRQAAPIHHFPDLSPVNRHDPAHLTVVCQRRMQRDPDLLLDELEWQGSHWLTRSRHHARVGVDPEDIGTGKRAVDQGGFEQYADVCGRALALTHVRGDRRSTTFAQGVKELLPDQVAPLIRSLQGYVSLVKSDCARLGELECGSA